jgi:hypothetical protein
MQDDANTIIEQQLKILPQDVRDAIASGKVSQHARAIGQNHHLHLDKIETLVEHIYFVLLGLMHTKEFLVSIQSELAISAAEAGAIASDVDRLVLSPIKQSLIQMQRALDEADKQEEAQRKPEEEILTTAAGNTVPIPSKLIQASQQPTTHTGPVPNIRTMPKDIAKIKMGESIRLPKEEIAMNYSSDPYREKPE